MKKWHVPIGSDIRRFDGETWESVTTTVAVNYNESDLNKSLWNIRKGMSVEGIMVYLDLPKSAAPWTMINISVRFEVV